MKREDSSRDARVGAGWKRMAVPAGLLLAAGLAGCSTNAYLEPAPSAQLAPHQEDAVVGEVAGVRVVAHGDAWDANPPDLGGVYTPVKVDISNRSGQPVDIRYEDFGLAAAGFTSKALPPYEISGSVDDGALPLDLPLVPAFGYRRFLLAPPYARFYDEDMDSWTGPFPFDFGYYRTYYPMWQESLPTRDMRAEAIPEGVLDPDGSLSGFVYFQKIDKKAGPVSLTFDVVNASTGKSLGEVKLPFVAR